MTPSTSPARRPPRRAQPPAAPRRRRRRRARGGGGRGRRLGLRPRVGRRRRRASTEARVPVPGEAPGRHRHPGPGPAALRGLRRTHRLARGAGRPAAERGPAAARQMTRGPVGGRSLPAPYDAPPGDTGEALGLQRRRADPHLRVRADACSSKDGKDRFGLADQQPAALRELPHFPADNLDPARSNGDLCVQACAARPAGRRARDPQPGPDRLRHGRAALGPARLRPHLLHLDQQATPRNLLGFKDGTANLKAEDPAGIDEFVWVRDGDDDARRLAGRRLLPGRSPHQHAASSRGTAPACASRRR